ncbi:Alpha-esterase 3 [Operophtera brumata]|uniref:Alpha-esterase 3 n=1 Tax=Operophtera brumata TaxID=104452 RepID=A0A0L7KU98_OPEBR|nr:Alpha-esterase 3 [Operophtera brumata]
MRWGGVLSLTAYLVTATRGQFLTIDHLIINSESPLIDNIENQVDRNDTLNNDENKSLDSISTANNSTSYRELNSVADDTGEGSISAESQSQGSSNVENPETTEIKSGEGDSEPQSSDKTDSQENISAAENPSAESASADISADNQSVASGSSGDADSGTNSNGEPNESNYVDNEQIVQTTHGPVKGQNWQETEIIAYIDIPYGTVESPFEAPSTAQPWTDDHEVKEHNMRCPQFQSDGYVGDLNCLTLSIFAPADAENASVFFYVHDSSFHSGDPMIYGPEHLVSKGVILVLPNYRIGALGFLCLQNETAPGNAGLKDLSLALEWIMNNIDGFGGNSSNIVVGGDGDAGALAGYLALSSRSKPYIHKVITESGSMLSHIALDRNPVNTAITLANNIRNNHSDGAIYNNTFAEVSVQTIVEAARGMRFNPCIEHDTEPFLGVTPWTLLQNNEIDITFMIGSASRAGSHEAVATTDSFIEQLNEDFELILPNDLLFRSSDKKAEHALRVKTQYFGNGTISRSQVAQLSLWFTDASYLGPLIRSARPLVDAGATVYLYEFDFVGYLNRELISLDSPVEGAVRSDIIGYLFTQDGHVPGDGTPEKRMIDLMVNLWVSFINTGTPTAENIQWEQMKAGEGSEEEYLHISSDPKSVKGLHVDRLELWTDLYNEYFIERNFALSLSPGHYAPESPPHWDGIFEATHRVKCPQDGTGDDNCLVVNVFTPEHATSLPVLVFVHDGRFQNGWGSYKAPTKLLNQGLVIVTFNYRLGPLGFLCLKIPESPGNAGLKDQIAALYWVQRNIANFGGDPYDVTVYGIGSGAAAVQILLLSGLATGLLHKVILESGSVLSPTSLTYEPSAVAFNIAKKMGYKHSDEPEKLFRFFQRVPLRQLTNMSEIFLPCVESSYYNSHDLLDEDPIEILKKGNFQEVPMVIVYSNTDGVSVVEKNIESFNFVPEHFDMLLPNNLRITDEKKKFRIAELVKEFYFDNIDGNLVSNYADYFHDVLFEYPIIKFGVLYAIKSSQPVYVMKFMYKSVRQNVLNEMPMSYDKIINYIDGDKLLEEDVMVTDRLLTLLCNFIKMGLSTYIQQLTRDIHIFRDPSPITTSTIPVIWKSVAEGSNEPPSVRTASVLQFGSTLTMSTTHKNQRLTFWDHVYESFYRTHSPTEDE